MTNGCWRVKRVQRWGKEGRIISGFKIERKGVAEQLQTVDTWAEDGG